MKLSSNALVQLALLLLTSMAGIVIYLVVLRVGTHLVVRDAHLWGLTGGLFLYLCQFLFASRKIRRARGVSYNTRMGIILIAFVSLSGVVWVGVSDKEAIRFSLEIRRQAPKVLATFLNGTDVNPKRLPHDG